MYKNVYLLFLFGSLAMYGCQGPISEGPTNGEVTQVVEKAPLWESKYGIYTKQLEEKGKLYFGETVITALTNGDDIQSIELPHGVVHRIVEHVKFEEEDLILATKFIRFASLFETQKGVDIFNGFDERGRTPMACLLVRPEFLGSYISGTTSNPLLSMISQLRQHTAIPLCSKEANTYERQKLYKVLMSIYNNRWAYNFSKILGLYPQYIDSVTNHKYIDSLHKAHL